MIQVAGRRRESDECCASVIHRGLHVDGAKEWHLVETSELRTS